MIDIVLKDVDEVLLERIARVGKRRGWDQPGTLLRLLEQGLDVCEGDGMSRFNGRDAEALESAVRALQDVPDDPGFAMIGRLPGDEAAPA